jgi:hypothetical protein
VRSDGAEHQWRRWRRILSRQARRPRQSFRPGYPARRLDKTVKPVGSSDSHSDHFSSGINRWASTSTSDTSGTNGSLAIVIAGPKKGEWYDHELGRGGGPWQLITERAGYDGESANRWLLAFRQ